MEYDKITIAQMHTETAIKLFFDESSPPTVHLIASSAFAIYRNFSVATGDLFIAEFEKLIIDNDKNEFWTALNRFANFFKHADRDHDKTVTFNDITNDLTLFFCCWGHTTISKRESSIINAYLLWFAFYNPKYLIADSPLRIQAVNIRFKKPENRSEWKKLGCELLSEIKHKVTNSTAKVEITFKP